MAVGAVETTIATSGFPEPRAWAAPASAMKRRAFGGQIGVGAIQGRGVHGLVEELPTGSML